MVNLRFSEHFAVRILNAQREETWLLKTAKSYCEKKKKEHIDGKHGISGWLWCVTASSYVTACYSFCKLRCTSSQNINFLWLMVWICSFIPSANRYWSILLCAGLLTTCKWPIHWVTEYNFSLFLQALFTQVYFLSIFHGDASPQSPTTATSSSLSVSFKQQNSSSQ